MSSVLEQPSNLVERISFDESQVKSLVRDLHRVTPSIYWTDLILTSAVGWGCFAFAVILPPFSRGMLVASVIAVFALYRGLCFMHEITHQNDRTLPGFEAVWNVLIGFPLLMPSLVYVGVHQDHHRISSYGTAQDPEYLPFAHSSRMTVAFALESFLIPVALLVRFLVLSPIGLLSGRVQRWLVTHASSLTINVRYLRNSNPAVVKGVKRQSIAILIGWSTIIALACAGVIPWRIFAVWLLVCAFASFVNTLRTLGAHAYESSGQPLDRMGQLIDSIDTPGRFWTELWAPVGLRYHALHHYFPGIPYHNLAEAYRRLSNALPLSTAYQKMSSPSLPYSLHSLLRKGLHG